MTVGGGDTGGGGDERDDVKAKFPWKIAVLLFVNLLGLSMICWSLFRCAHSLKKSREN